MVIRPRREPPMFQTAGDGLAAGEGRMHAFRRAFEFLHAYWHANDTIRVTADAVGETLVGRQPPSRRKWR
jgi:hypothetical protein